MTDLRTGAACALLFLSTAAAAAEPVGVVLGGGGARGSAHVGVLRVLEEMRIPIAYITGNSMGAIVGGLYASGFTPDEIESELKAMDWDDLFADAPPRPDRSFRRKRDDDLYLIGARVGFRDWSLHFPLAFIQGQKFDLHLNRLTEHVAGVKDFDRLPIPFHAIATDIETGRQVVLRSGNLARAIRASMAVPGGFAPVEIEGRLLVDGLVADNVPITAVREMGAARVIAIDVGTPLLSREEITNAAAVLSQLSTILSWRNVDEQIATLGPRDLLIRPPLGDLGTADFERVAEGIAIGERAAREARAALATFSVSEAEYERLRPRRERAAPPVIHFVRIENRSRLGDELIRARLTLKEGEPLDSERLREDIGRIYGLDVFETVRYEIVQEDGRTGVVVQATEKSWGPQYLQFGIELTDNFEGSNAYNLGFSLLRTAINPLNGEIRLGAQVGQDPGIFGEWHQPLDALSRYFTSVRAFTGHQNFSQFNADGDVISELRVQGAGLDLAAGREFGTWGEARLGYRFTSGDVDVRVGDPGLETGDFELAQIYARLSLDKFDNAYFPRSGNKGRAEYSWAREDFGSDSDFDQLSLRFSQAFSWRRNTLVTAARYDTTLDGTAPIESQFRAGGFLQLSGYQPRELNGQHFGELALTYYRLLADIQIAPTYGGFSLEYGNVWQNRGDISLDNGVFAGSMFLGVWSPIGPLYVGVGLAEHGRRSAFLYLGPVF